MAMASGKPLRLIGWRPSDFESVALGFWVEWASGRPEAHSTVRRLIVPGPEAAEGARRTKGVPRSYFGDATRPLESDRRGFRDEAQLHSRAHQGRSRG